jgi:hypothetical protein
MVSSAKSITNQCLQNMDKQIQARLQPEPEVVGGTAVPTPPPPEAPSQTEFMLNVAKDVAEDLLPEAKQRQLLLGAALALVGIGLLNWFTNRLAHRIAKILKEE